MKNLFLLLIIAASMTSCDRITYAYQLSYKVNVEHPVGNKRVLTCTSFYPVGNLLTPEEEACMLEHFIARAIKQDSTGYDHKITLIEDHDFQEYAKYHCP